MGKVFSLQQRVLTGYGAHTDPFSKDTGGFLAIQLPWRDLTADCRLVFRLEMKDICALPSSDFFRLSQRLYCYVTDTII
jgi:hypothetical protein